MNMNRRELIKGAAWSVPVIAAAVATPLAAASAPEPPTENRIRFTNLTARVGKKSNTVYANTKIQVIDGPAPVTALTLTITLRQGETTFTHTQETPHLPGWGGTPIFQVEQDGFDKSQPIEVFFTATALEVETITGLVTVAPPSWWS